MVNISLLEKSIPVAPIKIAALASWPSRWIPIWYNSERN